MAVGRVGKPHGLAGAFVVEDASDDPARFAVGRTVRVGADEATVEEVKRAGGRLVLRLDRAVQRGQVLQVPRAELPDLPEGSYYVLDLLGLDVVEEGGDAIGRVEAVDPGVANDVLVTDTGHALPVVEACVREVDLHARRIVVAPGFATHE